MRDALIAIAKKIKVIADAPITSFTVLILVIGIFWYFMNSRYGGIVDNLESKRSRTG